MAAKSKKSDKKLIEFLIFLLLAAAILFMLKASAAVSPTPPKPVPIVEKISGVYKGQLPCADCSGIEETLTLTASDSAQTYGSYTLEDLYQGKQVAPFITTGEWHLVKDNIMVITPNITYPQSQYLMVESYRDLTYLDSNMQKIDSPFNETLTRQ